MKLGAFTFISNSIKIMAALKQAFPGHTVKCIYKAEKNMDELCIDGHYAGAFDHDFFMADLDNPEIEITIKASKKKINAFVNNCNLYRDYIREAVEKGLAEWEEESQYKTESEDTPILDKIRADIESQREEISKRCSEDVGLSNYYQGRNDGLKDAKDILNKYKWESEGIRNERIYT